MTVQPGFMPLGPTLSIAADTTTGAGQTIAGSGDFVRVVNSGPNDALFACGPDSASGAAGATSMVLLHNDQIILGASGPAVTHVGAKTASGAQTAGVSFTLGRLAKS